MAMRSADIKLYGVPLNVDDAYFLNQNLNTFNRDVAKDHVANLIIDMESKDDLYLNDLVVIAFALPERLKNLYTWSPQNVIARIRSLIEQHPDLLDEIQMINGGHTTCARIGTNDDINFNVCSHLYFYKDEDELGAIKRAFDKARHRSGRDRMVFTGSTPSNVYDDTKVRFTKKELDLVHKALGPMIKGFRVNRQVSHMTEHSVETSKLTTTFAHAARSYLTLVTNAFKDNQRITKVMFKELTNAGLMGSFIFLMNNSRTQATAYRFVNVLLDGSGTPEKSKKVIPNFRKWLASEDNRVNPKGATDKTRAALRALEYYWGMFVKHGTTAVREDLIPGDEFLYKSGSGSQIIFSGLDLVEMERYATAFNERNEAKSVIKMELRMRIKELDQQDRSSLEE